MGSEVLLLLLLLLLFFFLLLVFIQRFEIPKEAFAKKLDRTLQNLTVINDEAFLLEAVDEGEE